VSKKGGKVEPRHKVRGWPRCTLKGRPSSEEFGKVFVLLSTPRKPGLSSPQALPRELRGTNRSTSPKQTFIQACRAVSKFKKELTFSLGVIFAGEKSSLCEAASRFHGFALPGARFRGCLFGQGSKTLSGGLCDVRRSSCTVDGTVF